MAGNKTALLLVFVTVFIDLLGFGIVLPLLPRYGRAFQADGHVLGLLMASFSAMQFLFAPVWGRVSDRIGRRPILVLGLAGSTASYALFGYATSLGIDGTLLGWSALTWLFVSRIGAGIAGATIPTAQAYIADVTDASGRGRGMAMIGAAFGIGFTFGPLIGAAFVSSDPAAAPSPMPGYVAAALSGIALVFAALRLPESLKPGEEHAAARSHWMNLGEVGRAVRKPTIGVLLLTIFMTTFAFAQFESTLALLTKYLGLGDRSNFLLFAYVGLVLTISQGGIVRRLLPKLGEYKMAVGGTAVMVVGLALVVLAAPKGLEPLNANVDAVAERIAADEFASAAEREAAEAEERETLAELNTAASPYRPWLFVLLPIAVLGFSAVTPSLQSLLSLRTDDSEQGEILGLGQSVSALARILGPYVGIRLFDEAGATAPFLSGAGLMVVGLILVVSLRSGDRVSSPTTESDSDAPAPAKAEESSH